MQNSKIRIKTAASAAVIGIALLLLVTIWPMRLYTKDVFLESGEVTQMTEPVSKENDAGEYFLARYDHIQEISLYMEAEEDTDWYFFQLLEHGENGPSEVLHFQLPFPGDGWTTVGVDADVTPGQEYILLITPYDYMKDGAPGTFRMGLTDFDGQEDPEITDYRVAFYHDTGIDHKALAMKVSYRMPIGTKRSAAAAFAVLAAAALCLAVLRAFFGKHPEKNREITVREALRNFLTPVITAAALAGLFIVLVLQKFGSRIPDHIVYSLGILIAAGICLYALWHKPEDGIGKTAPSGRVQHGVIMVCICLILYYSSRYMNAISDIDHDVSQSMIIALLCIMMLMMGRMKHVFHPMTAGAFLAAAAAGFFRYRAVKETPDMPYYLEHNLVTRTHLISLAFLAAAIAGLLLLFADVLKAPRGKKIPEGRRPVLWLILPFLALMALMTIMRNGRSWIPILAGMYLLLYIRFFFWEESGRFLHDLCCGIVLNFIWMAGWSMMRRYWIAYLYNRFSMHFHTVTVTAYYLLIVGCAALTLLLEALRKSEGRPLKQRLPFIWKELVLFGGVASYLAMSLTRAGIGAMVIVSVLAAILYAFEKEAAGRRPGRIVTAFAAMAISFIVTLPSFFTAQRILPSMVGDPYRFEALEPYPDELLHATAWDNTWFMNSEIFIRDFGDRILGGEIGTKIFLGLEWDKQQEYHILEITGRIRGSRKYASLTDAPVRFTLAQAPAEEMTEEAAEELTEDLSAEEAAAEDADEEELTEEEREIIGGTVGSLDTGDYSNGRMEMWKSYLQELDMKGHDYMGVTLPSGETAVHAHNVFLQLAFDCGIPAGILFLVYGILLAIGAFFYNFRQKQDPCRLLPLLIVFGFAMTGMVEWNFQFCNPFTIVLMMASMPLLMRDEKPVEI